ncbi:hypothetical protein MACJ_002578 [Theileria orientalis]|uniref:ABC transporter domain-containing protein n=1 Tax=Theileria orientalis TaxID=68886 RepID=A0A976QSS7_THEOR|nr:hypothetical protein MACJ_002578 [Theileria orientalis]
MGIYIKDCSPNFYISDNKFVPSTNMKSNVVQVTNQLPNDVVVYYKNATFAWVNTRHDLLNKKYEALLRNVNFELKRGQVAIVTGSQGSGKSNFVKSMLGEMTLVGGSMAVVPLHTSMPIFYASQDIFLQQGTIRSNITFGHRFDEQLYNAVLKAVELDYDISTWEKGDLRVVSENAHSLSGGQRVRMELARAVYAYLVFHKVNKDYNNSKCSFLMCLDASFHGLDPFVSKTIFNNLFNLKTGLLAKDDLSVVLTTSKQCLDLCSKTSDVGQFPDCPIYNLKDESLKFYSGLHNFIKNNRLDNIDYNYLSPNIGFCNIYLLSNDMFNLCSGLTSKPVRMELTRKKYNESFKSHSDDDFSVVTFANSAKNKQMAMLESMSQINSLCENAISGSSVYRSYKNEHSLLIDLFEMLVIPIVLDKYTKYKMKVGYFALALSLCMNLAESFAKFSTIFAKIKIYTCSLKRFTHFIPPGQKLKFGKFVNAHEEYIVSPTSNGMNRVNKNQLLRRRAIEFKNENKKFYALRRLFYHPKISIVDVVNYVYAEHTGVELKDVCVYTTPVHNPESMILKHLTVSAHKSEIIGMVGRTGAGKSTLLSVLHNIAENRTGQVLLDGKDLKDIPKVVLRQVIGVLPQLPFVFKGWTVRRFLDPRRLFTDDEINQALNKCALLNFVNELPGGRKLDTPIVPDNLWLTSNKSKNVNFRSNKIEKERSMSIDSNKTSFETDMIISNSQLRTLTLARLVLYRDFYRVIIVDEPPEEDLSEEVGKKSGDLGVQIYDILQKQFSNCTTFLTAHNTSVLKKCTSVWVMHEGSIVKTCKTSDIAANESIASIIEQNVKNN